MPRNRKIATNMIAGTILVVGMLIPLRASVAQQQIARVELPGSSLKWIHIAEAEFERRHLDLDRYNITVWETSTSAYVVLRSAEDRSTGFGSRGKYPGYGVNIDKKDGRIISSAYSK